MRPDISLIVSSVSCLGLAYNPYFAVAIFFACSSASSIAPTYMNAAFRQVVPLAVAQLLEAADRVLQRRELAGLAGERLGHEERLRQEPLDAAGPGHDLLVLFAQFLDAEDGDDVLQFAVPLQDPLHPVGDGEVLARRRYCGSRSRLFDASGSMAG